ncbi:hypothetical protein PIIN_07871 [Serendipita indica DSM 11827]|uniref:F-box domain-containing protein n=1 Tax=Serendipita indica (strain DSM 11827) TaxID=1109443 RepID=G4TRH1_SERID|nr:hypothetical protein PIIN_07871 [Serendipita indica DSM 11827]
MSSYSSTLTATLSATSSTLSLDDTPRSRFIDPPAHKSTIQRLNDDCLVDVFYHLAFSPLRSPSRIIRNPRFPRMVDIEVQPHQNLDLLACIQVSKAWYTLAIRALYATLVVRMGERDKWFERIPLSVHACKEGEAEDSYQSRLGDEQRLWARRRHWVQKVFVVGGGDFMLMGLPIMDVWILFPNIHDVSIVGHGPPVGGLLSSSVFQQLDANPCGAGILGRITSLCIAGTVACTMQEAERRQNVVELMELLVRLPRLQSLELQGYHYSILACSSPSPTPASASGLATPHAVSILASREPPAFALHSLRVADCTFSIDILWWIVSGSLETLESVYVPAGVIVEGPNTSTLINIDAQGEKRDRVEDMGKRDKERWLASLTGRRVERLSIAKDIAKQNIIQEVVDPTEAGAL